MGWRGQGAATPAARVGWLWVRRLTVAVVLVRRVASPASAVTIACVLRHAVGGVESRSVLYCARDDYSDQQRGLLWEA